MQKQEHKNLKNEYILSEFKELQEEKRGAFLEIAKDRNLGVIASGVFWSWYATFKVNISEEIRYYLCLVAPIVILLLILKWLTFRKSINEKVGYIIIVEQKIGYFGWERYLNDGNREANWPIFEALFWFVLLILNILAIFYFN